MGVGDGYEVDDRGRRYHVFVRAFKLGDVGSFLSPMFPSPFYPLYPLFLSCGWNVEIVFHNQLETLVFCFLTSFVIFTAEYC